VHLFGYRRVYKVTPFSSVERSLQVVQENFLPNSIHWGTLRQSLVTASLLRNQVPVEMHFVSVSLTIETEINKKTMQHSSQSQCGSKLSSSTFS
jgi:hypothetical protein